MQSPYLFFQSGRLSDLFNPSVFTHPFHQKIRRSINLNRMDIYYGHDPSWRFVPCFWIYSIQSRLDSSPRFCWYLYVISVENIIELNIVSINLVGAFSVPSAMRLIVLSFPEPKTKSLALATFAASGAISNGEYSIVVQSVRHYMSSHN